MKVKDSTYESCVQVLRDAGMRITNPRELLLRKLYDSPKALDAGEIFHKIHQKADVKMDLASVYRNLAVFEQLGLVHQGHQGKYQICTHIECHDHTHLVAICSRCGKAMELHCHKKNLLKAIAVLKSEIRELAYLEGLTAEGLCKSCA